VQGRCCSQGVAIILDRDGSLFQPDKVKGDAYKLLYPFLAKGTWQPHTTTSTESIPVSLTGLRSRGALEASWTGLSKLLYCGKTPLDHDADKVRPRWGYPAQLPLLTPAQLEELKAAQQLLVRHGEDLVEMGLLAP